MLGEFRVAPWEFFRRTGFRWHAFLPVSMLSLLEELDLLTMDWALFTLPAAPKGSSVLIFRTVFVVSTQLLCGAGTWKELVGSEQKDPNSNKSADPSVPEAYSCP